MSPAPAVAPAYEPTDHVPLTPPGPAPTPPPRRQPPERRPPPVDEIYRPAPPVAAPAPVLRVQGLTKHYGEVPVFAHIDLAVMPGEFVAIVGESGVGKSTLLNCLAGLDSWDSGSVRLGGIELGKLNDTARALLRRRATGFVFQAFHVLPHLSVSQNVALPLVLLGQGKDPSLPLRVEAALEAVGLDGLGARLPQQLSGGQLQRVAIARALIHRPPLLLADEPTGNVDAATATKVMDALIAQTREHAASLILATHSEAVAGRADRVLHLRPDGLYMTNRQPLRERKSEGAQTLLPISEADRLELPTRPDRMPIEQALAEVRRTGAPASRQEFDRRG